MKPKTPEEEFDAAPDAVAEFDAAPDAPPAAAPAPAPSRMQRVVDYLRATPGRIADTATSSNTIPSAMSGLSMNALPHLSAAVDTAPAVLRKAVGGGGDIGAEYDRNLRKVKPLYDEAKRKEPIVNVASMALSPNPLGKAGAFGRVAGAAGASALSEYLGAEPEALDSGAGDASMMAGGIQAGAEMAPAALRPMARGLRNFAGDMGLTAVGTRAGIKDALKSKGVRPQQISDLGNDMLDRGLVPSGLNPLEVPIEGAQRLAQGAQRKSGQTIGGVYEGFDASRPFGPLPQGENHLDFQRIRDASREPLIGAGPTELSPKNSRLARGVGTNILKSEQSHPGSAEALHREFVKARKGVNWSTETGLANTQHRDALTAGQNNLKAQVGEQIGPDELTKLNSANKDYRTATLAEDLSTNALSRDAQHKPFKTIRSMIAAGAAAGGGGYAGGVEGALMGLAAPKAVDLLMTRGPNVAAHSARAGSQAAQSLATKTLPPNASAATGSALEDYLRPMSDEERDEKSRAHFTGR